MVRPAEIPRRRMRPNRLLWLSFASSALLLGITVFRWSLVDILTPFLEPLLELFVFFLFTVVLLWALVSGLKGAIRKRPAALLPVGISLLALMAALFLPITEWTVDYDFHTGLAARKEVVRMLQSGELQTDPIIKLPNEYSHLSKGGGEVVIDQDDGNLTVLFFTYRGVLDNFAGFVYSSTDQPPKGTALFSDVKQTWKYQDHWYWISSW